MVDQKTNNKLTFISFRSVYNWSVQYLQGTSFFYNPKFTLVKIGSFLTKNKTVVEVQDEVKYKRVTIKVNNGGVFLRDTKIGKKIGTKKQFLVKKGQFLLSKIDARNGAFGVVTKEVNNAIITGNFRTFDVDYDQINPYFLSLLTTTPEFILFSENASNGTTNRHYLQEDLFLNVIVPLPSLAEQETIIDAYQEKIKKAKEAKEQAKNLEQEIEDYLKRELGIEIQENEEKKGLQFTSYKDLYEWGVDKIIGIGGVKSKKYDITTLGKSRDLSFMIKRGKSPKYSNHSNSIILNQKCNRWDKIDIQYAKSVDDVWIQNIDKNLFTQEKDVLINSTGEGTIGRASIVRKGFGGLLYDSHILILRLNTEKFNPELFTLFFNSSIGQKQVNLIKSAQATKQTELGITNLQKIEFPLPPPNIQKHIVDNITGLKNQIKMLRQEAYALEKSAKDGFEKEIFSSDI